ncbi:MAG: universal stress protein [Phycisphaeraceae bacterium]|nr:universal stress protein [Phycisphaeraceae bacterium]
MHPYRKIQVCIGHPDHAVKMLEYSAAVFRLADQGEIHLLHVDSSAGSGRSSMLPVGDSFLRELAARTLEGIPSAQVFLKTVEGNPLIEILKYSVENDIDLLVLGGGGPDPEHEAALARRITRKSTCSVLVLPLHPEGSGKRILVPVRDTECSAQAVATAVEIAEATGGEVLCLNVFQVHSGVPRGTHTLEEHIVPFKELADQECESLLSRVDTGAIPVTYESRPDTYGKLIEILLEAIADRATDLVVIGARGRTGAAGVLLGDTTEKLIRQTPVPLFAAKKKGECLGLFEALMTMAGQQD